MSITKPAMLKLLRATDIPKNEGRKNVLNKGQKYSLSMVLGRVKMMYGRGFAQSRHNKKFPELLKACRAFIKGHAPRYRFDACTINKNHKVAKHVDRNNTGFSYIIGLGKYRARIRGWSVQGQPQHSQQVAKVQGRSRTLCEALQG